MTSQGESSAGKRRFKFPNKTANLRRLKPNSRQEGNFHIEKRIEVVMNVSKDEGSTVYEFGSQYDRPVTPSFTCHGTSGMWEEPDLIEEDVHLIRKKIYKNIGLPVEEKAESSHRSSRQGTLSLLTH